MEAAPEHFQKLFRSLRTTELSEIFAKIKGSAAQIRFAQTYATDPLKQIFHGTSGLKLL